MSKSQGAKCQDAFSSVQFSKIFWGSRPLDPLRTDGLQPIIWLLQTHNNILFKKLQLLKTLKKTLFSRQKIKNISEIGVDSFVCFTVNEKNCKEPAEQQRKGKTERRRKLKLCFLSKLICLLFIFKPAILLKLKFINFQLCIQNKQLRLLVVLGLPQTITLITFLTNLFTNRLSLRFRCHFAVCSGKFQHFGKI